MSGCDREREASDGSEMRSNDKFIKRFKSEECTSKREISKVRNARWKKLPNLNLRSPFLEVRSACFPLFCHHVVSKNSLFLEIFVPGNIVDKLKHVLMYLLLPRCSSKRKAEYFSVQQC